MPDLVVSQLLRFVADERADADARADADERADADAPLCRFFACASHVVQCSSFMNVCAISDSSIIQYPLFLTVSILFVYIVLQFYFSYEYCVIC